MTTRNTMKRDAYDSIETELVSRQDLPDAGQHMRVECSNHNEVSMRVPSLKADVTGLAMHRGVASWPRFNGTLRRQIEKDSPVQP
jgi:hypothetical protein